MTVEWIDTKDGYPREDGMLVVVFDPGNEPNVWPAKWDAQNRSFSAADGWFEKDEVTHWAPLPEPPKSKAWLAGFADAARDEEVLKLDPHSNDYTHNPHQPTSPYTYPDYHCGPPTKEAYEWEKGYEYRQFAHQRGVIQLKITINTGGGTIETYM